MTKTEAKTQNSLNNTNDLDYRLKVRHVVDTHIYIYIYIYIDIVPDVPDTSGESKNNIQILSSIPKYWSLMADETQDCSTMEQLSVCIRYVSFVGEIHEDFIGFVKLESMDAKSIAKVLLSAVEGWGLDMSALVAQGYDGAAVMSSSKNGVQAKVKVKHPNVTYVHCCSHVLNLAISSGCKSFPQVRNLFDNVEKLSWYLGGSAKRKEIFLKVSSSCSGDHHLLNLLASDAAGDLSKSAEAMKKGGNRKTVPKFCATRWTARVSTLSSLLSKYVEVLKALENIRDCRSKK